MRALCESLAEQGFQTHGLSDPLAAAPAVRDGDFDLLLSDLMMPGIDGIQLLRQALEIDPNLVGIIMTGQGTIQTAVEAMKSGAFDYILKPFRLQQVLPILDRALQVRRLRVENQRLRGLVRQLTFESPRYQIVGNNPAIRKVIQLIEKVADSDATVLVRGPSGTGKELVARALHGNSRRRHAPLVTINCATLQDALLESELFGHEKGAFTGADRAKPGLFEVAEGGTLFIDEVAEMAPGLQAKLLRVLEDGHYRRVGSIQERHADVRIVAATNKPLEDEVKAGRFREDLFFRLNVITLTVPSLRDRREDVLPMARHYLGFFERRQGRHNLSFSTTCEAAIMAHTWPGNLRELRNAIERAVILCPASVIEAADLGFTQSRPPGLELGADVSLEDIEREHIARVVARAESFEAAARTLGIDVTTLQRKRKKYHMS